MDLVVAVSLAGELKMGQEDNF